MTMHYDLMKKLSENNYEAFTELQNEVFEQIQRGVSITEQLSACDRNTLTGMLMQCLSGEAKNYFITESDEGEDLMTAFENLLIHKARAADLVEQMSETAFRYYRNYLESVFEHMSFNFHAEENDNANYMNESY
jgi:hypothetical protein